jgi:hypothetical protein
MVEWFVIITIGCLPVGEQIAEFGKQLCFIDTKVVEAPVFDRAKAEEIINNFNTDLTDVLPGSFAIARYERRVKPEPETEDGKGQ